MLVSIWLTMPIALPAQQLWQTWLPICLAKYLRFGLSNLILFFKDRIFFIFIFLAQAGLELV